MPEKGRDDQHQQSGTGSETIDFGALKDPSVFLQRIKEVKTLTTFDESARVFVDHHIRLYNEFPYSVKTQSDEVKFLISLKMMSTLLRSTPDDERTIKAFYDFAQRHNLATKGRVASTLAILVFGNYLSVSVSESDKRKKIYAPRPNFFQLVEAMFENSASSLQTLDRNKFEIMADYSPQLAGEFFASLVEVIVAIKRILPANETLSHFLRRDGGFEILLRTIQSSNSLSNEPNSSFSLPFNELAESLSVSRSHVQKIFAATEDYGLTLLKEKGGKLIEITPKFQCMATEALARVLATHTLAFEHMANRLSQHGVLNALSS